jgi:hypothetical protein
MQWVGLSLCDKPSKFTTSECHILGWTDNASTLRRNVTLVNCHSRRFVGWTLRLGRNVAWSVRRCTNRLSNVGTGVHRGLLDISLLDRSLMRYVFKNICLNHFPKCFRKTVTSQWYSMLTLSKTWWTLSPDERTAYNLSFFTRISQRWSLEHSSVFRAGSCRLHWRNILHILPNQAKLSNTVHN